MLCTFISNASESWYLKANDVLQYILICKQMTLTDLFNLFLISLLGQEFPPKLWCLRLNMSVCNLFSEHSSPGSSLQVLKKGSVHCRPHVDEQHSAICCTVPRSVSSCLMRCLSCGSRASGSGGSSSPV